MGVAGSWHVDGRILLVENEFVYRGERGVIVGGDGGLKGEGGQVKDVSREEYGECL